MSDGALRLRMATAGGFLAMAFAVVALRAAQLALLEDEVLRARAQRQQSRQVALLPRRGEIVDRRGEVLALSRDAADIWARPARVPRDPALREALADVLRIGVPELERRLAAPRPFVWLVRGASRTVADAVEALGIAGVGADPARAREYPHGPVAAQLLGFVGVDGHGLEGLERSLDSLLRGRAASVPVVRDARGRWLEVEAGVAPDPRLRTGARVVLTLDAGLQHAAEEELERTVRAFRARAAVAVVLDPHTGAVLAMASVPRFDPNRFADSRPGQRRNRAVTDVYEPGSTFKAILAAAALDAGVVRPEERIDCEGGAYRVGGRTIHDHEPRGVLTFAEVIRYSSNIGSAKVAQRLGVRRYAAALARFGFGRPTGIELPGEVSGIVRPPGEWKPIDLVTAAYGHGIAVTPLQLARAYAVLANGGRQVLPHVVREVVGPDGSPMYRFSPPATERVVSPSAARAVRDLLVGVVREGTGRAAAIPGVTVAGKTGTARKVDPRTGRYSRRDHVASFVGFAPAEDPRVVVLVVVDSPRRAHYGGVVAAPAFRRIAEEALYRTRALPAVPAVPEAPPLPALAPAVVPVSVPALPAEAPDGAVPDLSGLGLRELLVLAGRRGWEVRVEGSGYVVRQEPPPGSPAGEGLLRVWLGTGAG